jgi:SH3-like domain-containing protein
MIGKGRKRARAAVGLAALAALLLAAGSAPAAPKVTPSGFPVPRYVSLKFGKVNARRGPGEDYPLLWVYRARGLPLQVIAETAEWRRVCDPQGQAAWVHKRGVDGARTAFRMRPVDLPMRARPESNGRTVAFLRPQSIAVLDRCDKGWCRLKAGGASGWVPQGEVWGAAPAAQCR